MESSDRQEFAQKQFLEHILVAEPVSTSAEYAQALTMRKSASAAMYFQSPPSEKSGKLAQPR
jgi:hypothetical protein